jgi:hypothetical protein
MKEILYIIISAFFEASKLCFMISIGVTCIFFLIYGVLALIEFIAERISHNTR